MLFFFSVYLRQ